MSREWTENGSGLTRHHGKLWKHVAMIFAVLTLSIANIGMAWGATTAPTGGPHIPGTTSTVTANGRNYEVFFSNNASTSSLLVGSNTSATTQATSTSGWCNIGSSCGNNNNNISTAFTLEEFVSNVKTSNNKAIRVQSTASSERNIVMVISGYDSIAVFGKSNDISVYAEIWNGSSYGASSALTLVGSKSQSSHYKRRFALDKTKQYRLTLAYQTSGSTNKDLVAFSLCVPAASCTARTFKSGEKVYFKDASGNISGISAKWKADGKNIYAYFWNDTENAWSTYGNLVSGSWNAANAIYEFTVPGSGKTYTKVLFTRGTAASWDGKEHQTSDQTPCVGENMYIQNTSAAVGGKYNGSWNRYSPSPALIGDFNDWDPDQGKFVDGRVILELEAETDYEFKVLNGDGTDDANYWSCTLCGKATNTVDPWQQLYSNQNNWSMHSAEAGEYCFHWNNSTHYLGIYYPQARFTKNKYIYFDARSESNWKESEFASRFWFKYYDSGSAVSDTWCAKASALEEWVFYTTIPDNDYVGQVQVNRYSAVDGTYWNDANISYASTRTSSKQNCMVAPSSGWSGINLTWGTYCPPMSSATLSDNSTVKISWQTGNGTSGNPYLVDASGSIKVSASATKAVPDENMTPNYDFKVSDNGASASSAQSGTGTTYDKGSLSNNHTYEISLDAWNSYNETNGTKNTSATHIWYKALTTYSVTHTLSGVTKSTGREGSGAAAYYQPYTATYAISTGYTMPATITVKFGSSTKTAGTDYTWNSSTGELNIPSGKIDGNVTIIIDGVAKTTAITLDKNNSDPGSTNGSVTATYGSSSLTSLVHATRTGYTQGGYETSGKVLIIKPDGTLNTSKDGYTSGSNWINESSSLTLYARWTANKFNVTHTLSHVTRSSGGEAGSNKATYGTEYSVVFAADGGYTLPAAVSVTVGESDVTANCTWNQSTGTLTIPAAYVTGNIVITVTGEAAVTYTVTYEYNGADGGLRPASATGASVSLPNPTKEGYTLQGWYTSSGSLAGAATATYNPTSNITLYALWREDACAGGGGGGSTTLFSTDFTESGWSSLNNTETAQTLTIGGHSVYVRANETQYLLSVNTSTGTLTWGGRNFSNKDCYLAIPVAGVNGSLTITVGNGSSETRFGYAVVKGSVIANPSTNTNTSSANPSVCTVEDLDGTSYVVFIGRQGSSNTQATSISITTPGGGSGTCYYVTYNGNGADGGFTKDEASHASGSDVTVKTNSFTKTGYTFTGWKTEPSGGTSYAAGGTISGISGNMTLYAQWEEEVACSTAPTVTAGSNSSVTSTTATVSCESGISSLGTGGCTITSYGFVIGTSTNPEIGGVGVTRHEVGTSYASTGASFSKDLTGLTEGTTYYVRPYATNGFGTAYGTQTNFTTSAAPVGAPVITVQPTLSEVALGETASFSLTATGATSYQWYSCDSEGENRVEASGASATTDNYSYTTTATGTTYYICKVSNASGDTWSDVVGSIVTPATFTVKYTAGAKDGETYNAETFTQGHEAVSEVADKFSNWSNYTFTGVGISSTGKKGTMSMLISMPTAYDADKYVSFHFDLAANYQLQLTNVNLQVQAKDNVGQSFKFVISDEYGHSYTKEVASLGQTGKLVQIGGDISETTKFVGTITLKLYGWYSSTDYYRLAKEVTITGEVSSLPAPTASWTARPASATVGDGGKTYTLTTDGTNTVAWSITDQSGATGAVLSPTSGLTTTLDDYSAAGSLYVQASVTGDGIHYLSTPATLLRQRVVISGDCSETTLISATLSSGTATGSVTGTPGGTSAVSFTSVKEVDGGYKMGGDGSYVYLTLSGDENFAANDEVKITITKASDQGDGALHIYKYASSAWTELGSVVAAGAGTYSYTLTETNVSTAFNTIGLYRTEKNQNPYVKALSVVRNSCSASKPSGVTVTASAAGPYAINDALTLTVTATNADTYQWYSNTNNTASDGFLLVGETATTYSPSTAIAGTTYYYCVATNTSGSTVSNIITVTVNSAKTAPTVSWTDTYETPNYGGGGYAVKATVSTAEWDGTLTTDMLTASDGVTLTGVSVSGKVITATYGVTETARSPLSFSLTLPETTNYTALAANKEITFTRCGEGAVIETTETKLPVKSSYTTASNPTYRWETAGVGWLTLVTGSSTLSSTSDSYSGFSYRSSSGKSSITFYSELDAVSAVRIYIKGGGSTTLSKVQKGTTFGKYTQLAPSTDYDYSYSNGSSSIESREQAYIEITFKTALSANTFVEITLSRNTEYYGVGLITGNSEVGNITTALSWATDPGTTVNKYTTDANFRHEAEKASDAASQATLGTISYKSSVPAVATVSATGVVDILSAGSTTITATLASSGCYKKATLSYNLVVAAATCTDVAGTITASGSGITIDGNTVTKADACAAVTLTVSGHTGEDAGATYQWYKDGESLGGSFQTKSISVTDNGDYTVEVTNAGVEHCTMPATNTITITGNAISITKIVDEWYVKNDRRTPDIALATIEGTTSYTVNDGSSNITTFAGCGFELRDGILYLKGTQDDGSAPSGLAAGDVTLTITAVSACGDDPTATITIHKQVKTAKSSIAFIVDGTKGDPVNSVATTKTSSRPIWIYLSESFDLTGCNAYWTNNEKQIRQYYSQFDAIVITDDPSTDEKPKSGLKYVNALGTMVDVRPILTMEAYVGKYGASSNWHIGGTPSSPNPRQYELKLQCKDHDIFSDLTPSANFRSEEIGGETYYYVTMVDNSVTPYAGLADDAETETYPALQGFSAASIKGTGMLGIGTISDGTLQGGVERQDEPTARMMILGIQHQAMAALTSEGKQVIKNAINYLLKTNMEEVDDCSNYFIGGTVGHEQEWHTASNWSSTKVPDASTKARIMAPVTISTTVHVAQVDIAVDGKSIHYDSGNTDCSGSVTIAPTGALIVDGQVRRTTNGRLFTEDELQPTTPADLTILSSSEAQGALIFDNNDGETQATVEMYSPSYWEVMEGTNKKKSYWSYVGVPIQDVPVGEYFYGAVTYLYDETSGWIRKRIGSEFHAFEGIGLSLPEGNRETFYGTLASTETKEITLTKTTGVGEGDNLIGNSWTAPIQIGNFDASDFGSATAVVSMYKTGRDDIEGNPTVVTATAANDGAVVAGQWVSIPIGLPGTDGYDGPTVIPSMQAFQVTASSETTLTLDYDKLVRDVTIATDNLTQPMSAPKRKMKHAAKKSLDAMMRVRMSGFKTRADLWIMEDGRFSDEYDNGWEANYIECDNRSPQLYANSEIGKMAFLAKPDIEGTILGIAPSRDGNEYLFTFHYVGDEEFYLNDLKLKQSVLISEEESYSFMYEDGDTNRFYISRTRIDAPQMPTGVENTHGDAVKARKFIYNDKLYIMLNGRVYSAEGQLVK